MHPNVSAFEAREYWRGVLRPSLDDAALPTDRSRPPRLLLSRETLAVDLRGPTFARLLAVSGGGDFLLYAVLVAALGVCVRQHGGAPRVTVGSPMRRESDSEIARLLPIFAAIEPGKPFRELLVGVRQALLDAYACQQVDPLALLPELGRTHSENRHPFVDVVLRLDSLHGPIPRGQHDIEIDLRRTETGLEGELRFREALWDRATMVALFARYEANLAQLLADVEQPICRIDGLPAAEREALLRDARGPSVAAEAALLHELILARAQQDPDAPALVRRSSSGDGHGLETVRSYAQLLAAARGIAGALQAVGVVPGAIVGVVGRRDAALVEALLGVLMAGAAYLPLDGDGPPERLAAMLRQAKPTALLALESAPLLEATAEAVGAQVVRPADADASQHRAVGQDRIGAAHPAYLLFTSGSTGAPKGVLVGHHGVVNYLRWAVAQYRFDRERPTPWHGAIDTDLGITSLWGPLVAGGALLLVDDGHGVEALAELLHGGTALGVVKLTPTHLGALSYGSSTGTHDVPPSCLVIGGEALRASLAELWLRHDASSEVYNEYGPTETVVGSTVCRIGEASSESGLVPIGRPIANTRVHVLSEDLQLCPRGATGELFIGGAGVSHGYLGDPRLTAARFIPDPFADTPGQRLYRTGDLARDLGGGVLEFRGRCDEQLKIRGHRVELAEVEAALARLPGVREAVALARTIAQRTELVAYIVPAGRAGSLSAMRRELRQWLTEAMMPTHFVVIDAIPRQANGKLDRAALPKPQQPHGQSPRDDAGTDPVIEALAEVWARVLGLPDVGPQDNFFDLGGDSILSVHVVAEARQVGLHVLLNDLFQFPTIAELAPRVRFERVEDERATPTDVELPLLPIQRWWLAQQPAEVNHFNQSLLLRLSDDVDLARVERALDKLVARHDALRVAFREHADGWTQRLSRERVQLELGVVDLAALSGPARRHALAHEATRWQASMNIGAGELVRAVVFTGVAERPLLLLCIHHLAADAATWSVLLGDLARAFDDPEASLSPPSLSPWAWAEALAARVEAGEFVEARRIAQQLATLESARIPASGTPGAGMGLLDRSYTSEASHRVIADVSASYPIRLDELLLAALVLAAAAWLEVETVVIEREVHGRDPLGSEADFSRAVGWFASFYPMILRADADLDDHLTQIRTAVRNPPEGGIGYLARASREASSAPAAAAFLYNHLGRVGALPQAGDQRLTWFEVVDGERGVEQSPRNGLPQTIVLDSMVAGDQLRLRWRWRGDRVAAADVEWLCGRFDAELARLVEHCLSGAAPRFAPADFELAGLDQAALDSILSGLDPDRGET